MQLTPTVSVIDLMCSVKQIVEYVSWEENMLSESIGIEYDFDINYKLEKGITDLTWFTENIFCLITNAVKYSIHPGGIRIAIKTIFIGTENYATFSVQDSGVSLSTKKLEVLFDPPLQVGKCNCFIFLFFP